MNSIFTTEGLNGNPDVTIGPSLPVVSNTWYDVLAIIQHLGGNSVDGVDGNLTGTVGLATLDAGLTGGASLPTCHWRVPSSISPRRWIRIDPSALGSSARNFGYLVGFSGRHLQPDRQPGVVPEPASASACSVCL